MMNKLLLLSLVLFVGCGKELSSSSQSKLESFSQITVGTSSEYKHGTLTKVGTDTARVTYNGQTYSTFSGSQQFLSLLRGLADGQTISVKFLGSIKGTGIEVTEITQE